ncbi:MAG: hypothetical protein U0996_11200 [Planctomycetaceae bacterium]
MTYDLCVVGNDEASLELAFVAARHGQNVLSILPEQRHSSWMMSQALEHLVSNLLADMTDARRRQLRRNGSPRLVQRLLANSLTSEMSDHVSALENVGADVSIGEVRFQSADSLVLTSGAYSRRNLVRASNVVIGMGVRRTAVHRPLGLVPFHRPESLLCGSEIPKSLCILGGGGLGAGLAALFSLFGSQVRFLSDLDPCDALLNLAEDSGVVVATHPAELGLSMDHPFALNQGDIVDCRRSEGFTDHLGLSAIGIEPDEHGLLWCSSSLETWTPGVFGIGDVIGFSSGVSQHPTEQAMRILNRMTHRIRKPHFLRTRSTNWAMV